MEMLKIYLHNTIIPLDTKLYIDSQIINKG
jgi:hypothetical protein